MGERMESASVIFEDNGFILGWKNILLGRQYHNVCIRNNHIAELDYSLEIQRLNIIVENYLYNDEEYVIWHLIV